MRWIIGLPELSAGEVIDFARELDPVIVHDTLPLLRMVIVVDPGEDLLTAWADDPRVAWVEEDSEGHSAGEPWQTQDVSNPYDWKLDRITKRDLADMDGEYRWRLDGTGVRCYVVDSGVRGTHDEFAGRIEAGYSAVGGSAWTDADGHGTMVAGCLAGATTGVARGATIVPVRIWTTGGFPASDALAGIEWVLADYDGESPGVVNCSWAFSSSGSGHAALRAAFASLLSAGLTVFAAANNDNAELNPPSHNLQNDYPFPARLPGVMAIGASNVTDERRATSNYGPKVDLFAPGEDVRAPTAGGDSTYGTTNGTSFASPLVAGVAALWLQQYPHLTPSMVRSLLVYTSTANALANLPADTPNRLLYSIPANGHDDFDGIIATGGTVTDVDGWRYHVLGDGESLDVTTGGKAEVLLVASGGGAGSRQGGGGGGGGVVWDVVELDPGSYPVTIGPPGAGGTSGGPGTQGGDATFAGRTAVGGGFGGGRTTGNDGGAGGSGGGGAGPPSVNGRTPGGSGTAQQGQDGGRSSPVAQNVGGGGGGAGQQGHAGVGTGTDGGTRGGDGLFVPWAALLGFGDNGWFGGGGAGAGNDGPTAPGGHGGGGGSTNTAEDGEDGQDGTGGGGGACRFDTNQGGRGGLGTLIVRYPIHTPPAHVFEVFDGDTWQPLALEVFDGDTWSPFAVEIVE